MFFFSVIGAIQTWDDDDDDDDDDSSSSSSALRNASNALRVPLRCE